MRKGWLIAGAIGATAGMTHAAEVELFGVHTPSLGKWAVYARISDPTFQATPIQGIDTVGLSSIGIDVLNNGASTVTTAVNALPRGTSKYVDTTAFPDSPEGIGYGFWLKDLRSNGTVGSTGAVGITGAQYAIYPIPTTTVPYQRLVVTGAGLTRGSITQNDTTGGDYKTSTNWSAPVMVAQGTYTPAGTTGAGARVGLKMQFSDATGAVNLLRPVGNDFDIEAPDNTKVNDARNFVTGGSTFVSDGTTVLAGSGDANLDGRVNFSDLARLAQNYNGSGRAWFDGDFNYDGLVNFSDLAILAQNYNKAVPSEPLPQFGTAFDAEVARAFAAVPEPGTLGLVGVGLAGLTARRRRRR